MFRKYGLSVFAGPLCSQVTLTVFASAITVLSLPTFADSSKLEFGGHNYQRIDGSFTWTEAKQKCESLGAHLATITSKDENTFVLNNVADRSKESSGWLGGTDAASEGNWQWVTGEIWSFSDWGQGSGYQEPNNGLGGGAENILGYFLSSVYVAGSWNDYTGGHSMGAICEWEPVATCDTTTPYNQGYAAAQTACKANPSACGIIVGTGSTTGSHASYTPSSNSVHIPYLDVPTLFGGTPTVYEVDFTVMPNTNPLQLQLQNAKQVP